MTRHEPSPSQSLILAEVLAAETAVWRALSCGDSAADAALLAHDFLGVYPSGFATRQDHVAQLSAGATVANFTLEEPRVLTPAPGVALLSYRARYRRAGRSDEELAYVSSLWRHANGAWINLFSQDTPAA